MIETMDSDRGTFPASVIDQLLVNHSLAEVQQIFMLFGMTSVRVCIEREEGGRILSLGACQNIHGTPAVSWWRAT
jgi:hypothetical protein